MTQPLPLSNIRVLDFSRVLAGPFCTMLLADMGADVVKIEHPAYGDETRAWGPPWAGKENPQSAYYLSINRNKRSIALDLKHPEGLRIAQSLAQEAQIVVENFKPGTMQQLGLDFDTLRQRNPALVFCSITGFGQTGPYKDRPGYDYLIQAMSGLMSVNGPTDGESYKVGVAVSDVFTGLFAANGILSALRQAETTGHGQYLDMALFDSQLAALVNIASNYLVSGVTPQRIGNQHPNIVPYQTFQTADSEFVLAIGNDRQFSRFCTAIEHPEIAFDARFETNAARVTNREALVEMLQGIIRNAPTSTWLKLCVENNIPASPVNTVADAIEDAHTVARQMIQPITLRDGSQTSLIGSPINLNGRRADVRMTPPELGEHTIDILSKELGMDDEVIQRLLKENTVRA